MIYIRRKRGGRVDAWDGRDEYTRVDSVTDCPFDRDRVLARVEQRGYITRREYLVELVELEAVRVGDGSVLTTLGEYISDRGDRCDGRDVPVAEAARYRRYYA